MSDLAFCTDFLLERDAATETFEMITGLYPEAPIYTYAHNQGALLGNLEHRPIYSTYMSRMVKDAETFYQKSYLVPGAKLKEKSNYKKIFYFSRGLAEGLLQDSSAEKIIYRFSDERIHTRSWREKIFGLYLKHWKGQLPLPHFSTPMISQDRTISPGTGYNDFTLYPEAVGLTMDFYIGDFRAHPHKREVYETFERLNTQLLVLEEERESPYQFVKFIGVKCTGDLPVLLNNARAVLDFSGDEFPVLALRGWASGRPVALPEHEYFKFLENSEGLFVDQGNWEELIKEIDQSYTSFNRNELRRQALSFNDLKFKNSITSLIENEIKYVE